MNRLRQFIIKNWFLDTYFRVFGLGLQFPRVVKWYVGAICSIVLIDKFGLLEWNTSPFTLTAVSLIALVSLPLWYLKKFRPTWDELDVFHKHQFGEKYVDKYGLADVTWSEKLAADKYIHTEFKRLKFYRTLEFFIIVVGPFILGYVYTL